jgi:hypothetical protein
MKCHHHLHPWLNLKVTLQIKKSKIKTIVWIILEMTTNTNKVVKELVNKKLLIFG